MRFTTIFFILISFPCLLLSSPLPISNPQHDDAFLGARLLDSNLQALAFKSFFRPRTGIPYDAKLPSNLTGVKVSVMRLKSGSLFYRGVQNYREFEIPIGVIEKPYVERIVLVYQNLGNWSEKFYPLPNYSYLAPVVGLLAYSGANLSASLLPELQISASKEPILIKFPKLKLPPLGSLVYCVHFDLNGTVKFDTLLVQGNNNNNNNSYVCSTFEQGHFSIVVASNATKSSPHNGTSSYEKKKKQHSSKKRILIPCLVVGVILLMILVLLLVFSVRKTKQGTRIQQLESVSADRSGNLRMTSIGETKAPFAIGTRTRPVIENDYFP